MYVMLFTFIICTLIILFLSHCRRGIPLFFVPLFLCSFVFGVQYSFSSFAVVVVCRGSGPSLWWSYLPCRCFALVVFSLLFCARSFVVVVAMCVLDE